MGGHSSNVLSHGHPPLDEVAQVALAQCDPQAFAPLYDHYVDPIYRYCFRRLGDPDVAADVTSQIFVRALAALPTYKRTGSFRSWLFTIAHNAVVDRWQTTPVMAPLEQGEACIDPAPGPEEEAVRHDAVRELRAVLTCLPRDQRQVVELRLAGLTSEEMATVLERSIPAVRMLQARALRQLRRLLDPARETSAPAGCAR